MFTQKPGHKSRGKLNASHNRMLVILRVSEKSSTHYHWFIIVKSAKKWTEIVDFRFLPLYVYTLPGASFRS